MTKVDELVHHLSEMRVSDLVQLSKRLEEDWGVSARQVAPQLVPGDSDGQTPDQPTEEVQTEFALWLTDFGPKKINVIKVTREVRTLDLKSAKELVEAAPVMILEGLTKEDAEKHAAKFLAEDAKVEIR